VRWDEQVDTVTFEAKEKEDMVKKEHSVTVRAIHHLLVIYKQSRCHIDDRNNEGNLTSVTR
jgi:hypothetical protein